MTRSEESKLFRARQKRSTLEKDLWLLGKVVFSLRSRLVRKEKNKQDALVAYHKHAETTNRRRSLPALFRAAIRHGATPTQDWDPRCLEAAMRNVIRREDARVEAKLLKRIRTRFEKAMKMRGESSIILEMTGAPLSTVRQHLEARFSAGMCWSNHGWGSGKWNIDHIRPLASFDRSDPEWVRQAFHFTNLQPLWHEDNARKRAKFILA